MLRNDTEVALHDLLEALTAAAHLYADDAEALGEDPLAGCCRKLALRREQLAAAVAAELRRRDDLPSEPDPDRETLARLGQRLRTLFSRDEREVVVAERLEAESAIERLAQRAAELVAEPASRQLFEEIEHDAEEARLQLSSFAAS
ncbi:MAG TPA: hypothetical protein VFY81_00805 [Gammaproteobacteria bacterium]|nr:hypothetical protein [Gammaproteobacteria bacterium]